MDYGGHAGQLRTAAAAQQQRTRMEPSLEQQGARHWGQPGTGASEPIQSVTLQHSGSYDRMQIFVSNISAPSLQKIVGNVLENLVKILKKVASKE